MQICRIAARFGRAGRFVSGGRPVHDATGCEDRADATSGRREVVSASAGILFGEIQGRFEVSTVITRVRSNPKFAELVAKRNSLALSLTIAMLVIYFGFILLVAFAKGFLATPIGAGLMTWGVPIGLGTIVAAFVLTGYYVSRANAEFDTLTQEIVEETNR